MKVSRGSRLSLRVVALGYLFVLRRRPDRRHPVAHLLARPVGVPRVDLHPGRPVGPQPVAAHRRDRRSRSTSSSASSRRSRWCAAAGSAAADSLQAVVDLPFAVSPIVVGVSLIMLWGAGGWFGALDRAGFKVIFGLPGMVLATIFVTLPFVVREVEPVLHEIGLRAGAGRRDARRRPRGRRSGGSRCRRSGGA